MSNLLQKLRSKKLTSSRAQQERHESSGSSDIPHVSEPPIHNPEDANQLEDVQINPPPKQEQQQPHASGLLLIARHRGTTTCKDIRDLPPGKRVVIEINSCGQPCNFPESTMFTSYMGVLAKDAIIAPISFKDWRDPGMEPYKRQMVDEFEAKFAYNPIIRQWVRQSLGIKWRAHKTSLKSKYFAGQPFQEVIKNVPQGVDPEQWATIVTRWDQQCDKDRSVQNTINAQKLKCPHSIGRTSSVKRQQETCTTDRLLLWKINRLHKDKSWNFDDAKLKWDLVCQLLAQSNLTPEDGNVEENERVFKQVMGPEHPGRVRCKGLGMTPSKFYPGQSSTSSTGAFYLSTSHSEEIKELKTEFGDLKNTVSTMNASLTKIVEMISKKKKKKKKQP